MQPGRKLLHYEILAKLGEGGMGEVYKARDTRLNRDVALKVLAPQLARNDRSVQRFRREAQAIAATSHPNIVTVYAVEQDDDLHFITMELVHGHTLDRAIPRGGLASGPLLDLALPIAEGLAAAHERGITHRDLKPANVMLDDSGRVRILDFGLAKVDSEAGAEPDRTRTAAITQEGAIVGTVPYMSPEQVEGKPLDRRTDVFSFGVILYEMATGVRPFRGETQPALMSSILRDAPAPLSVSRTDLPGHLEHVVRRCLEKAPAERYASASDLVYELKSLRSGGTSSVHSSAPAPTWVAEGPASTALSRSSAGEERSIAVLPFLNRSANPDDQYFSDGLSEELINALSRIRGIKVTARSSAFQFRGQERDVREVGEKLGVECVLEGSVRIAGSRLRITTELVNCTNGYQLWSERFDGEMKDIFDTQDEIAQAIVKQLKVELGSRGDAPLVRRGTENLDAYHLLLKARHHMADFWEPGVIRAIECLEQAVEIDPGYALAYADMAFCWLIRSIFGSLSGKEGFPRIRSNAQRALELDPQLGDAHAAWAIYLGWHDFDWEAADRAQLRAVELNPQSVWAHFYCAGTYSIVRRHDDIPAHVEKMRELDPLNRPIAAHVALFLFYANRVDEAIAAAEAALEMFPDYWLLYYNMSFFRWKKREGEAAIAAMQRAIELTGESIPFLSTYLAAIYFFFGHEEEGRRQLDRVAEMEKTLPRSGLGWIVLEASRGNTDAAIAEIERGVAEHDTLTCWARAFCEQQGLIRDERLREAMARAGMP
jgi:serine/threonine protein kinase/tetratricopeptide (TPR) repeat protein